MISTDDAPIGDLKRLLKKLERVAEGNGKAKGGKRKAELELEALWRAVLAARLMRRAKRLGASLDDAGSMYAPDRLHDVRISTKKLRYALEIARDAGVAAAKPLLKVLKRHQERLGHLHDLQMLLKHVRETETLPGVGSRHERPDGLRRLARPRMPPRCTRDSSRLAASSRGCVKTDSPADCALPSRRRPGVRRACAGMRRAAPQTRAK